MNTRRFPIGLAAFLLLAVVASAAAGSRPIRPTGYREAITLTIEGEHRSYWSFDLSAPLEFEVRGPGRVKLITRLALGPADTAGAYGIAVHRNGEEISRQEFEILPAIGAGGGAAAQWGRHRNLAFDVPAGPQRYRVVVEGSAGLLVAGRPRFLPPARSRRRVSITPAKYDRVLTLVRDEKEITYYRVTPDSPIELTLVGPTDLQVTTRLEFDRNMKGASHCYAVDVCEKGTSLARASFEVDRSQVCDYPGHPEIVPGVVKTFRVRLDEGPHEIEIRLGDTTAPGAGVRLYLPADDLARGGRR